MQFTARRESAETVAKAPAEGMKAETARRTDVDKTKSIYNMNTIRYYIKFGHTKSMVNAVKDLMDSEPRTVEMPLFAKLRETNNGSWQHTGGCTLYEHREEVEQILGNKK